jgi:CheY-like chemotaxis protein
MTTVLYVDDEIPLLELGKAFLEMKGQFSVQTITSASEALILLQSHKYDAIISDYQMPGLNGIEFLNR